MKKNEEMTDEEIILSVQSGDKDSFGFIIDRYEKKLLRYGKKFIAGTCNIEDVVQDVFIKTYENIMSFDTALKFSSWIYRIAHNIFINEIKKKKTISFDFFNFDVILPHYVFTDSLNEKIIVDEIKNIINKGLHDIDIKYREVLLLYYMEELSYKEISDVLEIPVGTVGVRLKRAKMSLKKQLPLNYVE